jgi:CRP-like cAMP-binding protein
MGVSHLPLTHRTSFVPEVSMGIPRLELLKNMPIFGAVNDGSLSLILAQSRIISVDEGELFFREGDEGRCTYVLEAGHVSVVKAWNERDYELLQLGVGDCFGEMALIDFGPRSASVRVLERAVAIELSANCLLQVANRDPEQYALIYMNMARELSRRLRRADERLFQAKVVAEISDADFTFSSI